MKTIIQLPLLFIGILSLLIIGCGSNTSTQQGNESLTLSPDDLKTIELAISEGYIRFEAQLNKVWVQPNFWEALPYQSKENFGAMCAIYCANEKGTNLYWVDIMDDRSGKKLAKWSKSWGFEVK